MNVPNQNVKPTETEQQPAGSSPRYTLMIVLLAVTSLLTTVLVGFTAWQSHQKRQVVKQTQKLPDPTNADPAKQMQAMAHGHAHRPPTGASILHAQTNNPLMDQGLPLGDFSLTGRDGLPTGTAQLRGKVWVVDFIFTRCPSICPMLTANMKHLRNKLKKLKNWDAIRLVSISVDPTYDTPGQLSRYVKLHQLNDPQWLFLTGTRSEVWAICRDQFKQSVRENDDNLAVPIVHTSNFLLIDRQGKMRGRYDGLKLAAQKQLISDLQKLLAEPGSKG